MPPRLPDLPARGDLADGRAGLPLVTRNDKVKAFNVFVLIDDLNICIDENYTDKNHIDGLKEEGYTLLKKLNGYIKYIRNRKSV